MSEEVLFQQERTRRGRIQREAILLIEGGEGVETERLGEGGVGSATTKTKQWRKVSQAKLKNL